MRSQLGHRGKISVMIDAGAVALTSVLLWRLTVVKHFHYGLVYYYVRYAGVS